MDCYIKIKPQSHRCAEKIGNLNHRGTEKMRKKEGLKNT
jgi:hypothetical protein